MSNRKIKKLVHFRTIAEYHRASSVMFIRPSTLRRSVGVFTRAIRPESAPEIDKSVYSDQSDEKGS